VVVVEVVAVGGTEVGEILGVRVAVAVTSAVAVIVGVASTVSVAVTSGVAEAIGVGSGITSSCPTERLSPVMPFASRRARRETSY
jgi:hypothetical protein